MLFHFYLSLYRNLFQNYLSCGLSLITRMVAAFTKVFRGVSRYNTYSLFMLFVFFVFIFAHERCRNLRGDGDGIKKNKNKLEINEEGMRMIKIE